MTKFLAGVAALALMGGWLAGAAHANPTLKNVFVNGEEVTVGEVDIDVKIKIDGEQQVIPPIPPDGLVIKDNGFVVKIENNNTTLIGHVEQNADLFAELEFNGEDGNIEQNTDDVVFDEPFDGGVFQQNVSVDTGIANITQQGNVFILNGSPDAAAALAAAPPSQGSSGSQTSTGGILGGLLGGNGLF